MSGGKAMNAGARYQAHVIAATYVHVITERPLSWFGPVPHVPTAVWGESLGPGDDVRVEFGTSSAPAELQARHDMDAGKDLTDFVDAIRSRSVQTGAMPVALLVARKASGRLRGKVAEDLNRLRGGRDDRLGTEIASLLSDPTNRSVLERLFIVSADFDEPHNPERTQATEYLRRRLVDGSGAETAYDLLVSDALELSATEGRRDTAYLDRLLEGRGFEIKPLEKDEPWSNRLDWVKESLLDARYDDVALYEVERLIQSLASADVTAPIRARTEQLRAVALMRLARPEEALAAAQRAIAIDPSSADALITGARAAVAAGEAAIAVGYSARATEADPSNPKAWAARTYAAVRSGTEAPTPPARIAETLDYRTILVQIARDQNDFPRILEVTAPIVGEPGLQPEVRFMRAQALALTAGSAPDEAGRTLLLEAARSLTELLDDVRAGHPIVAPAYVVRSQVRRLLGLTSEAEADLLEAERVNQGDPDVIEQTAANRAAAGDFDGALRVLRSPAVDSVPTLLAVRAEMLIAKGLPDEARRDLETAVANVPPEDDHDEVYYRLAETALVLGDSALARTLADRVSASGKDAPRQVLLAADMAFAEGDAESGIAKYREAIVLDPANRVPLLMRLGIALLGHRRPADALAAFDEVGVEEVPRAALHPYATAGLQAKSLASAQAAIDRVAKDGPLPPWALAIAADIALWRDDPETAAAHLMTLEREGAGSARVRLALARCLVELGREDEALDQARAALLADPTPGDRIQAAVYLKEFGEPEAALNEAFQAYREERRDPRIQRMFASLVMTSGVALPAPEIVAADTYVRLRHKDGSKREHTILVGQPIDPPSHEMTEADAATAGLIGRRVGDIVARDAGHWSEQQWTVEQILPAKAHVAQEIMRTFADNFPGEPFFVVSIHIGDGEAPGDWAGLMAALSDQRDRAEEVLRLYHAQVLPLDFIVSLLPVTVPELMAAASSDLLVRPLLVEWSDLASQAASVAAATEAQAIILTRSALATAQRLALLEAVAARYEVVIPTSLVWQLRVEIAELKRAVASGRSTLSLAAFGPHIDEIPADDPRLQGALAAAETSLGWVEHHARKEPRPHRSVFEGGTAQEELRDRVGPASFDAVALGETGVGAMYADDLGLRRLSIGLGPRPQTFSTTTLLDALADSGHISPEDRDRHLVDLVLAGYAFVRPTHQLLAEGLRRMPGLGAEGLQLAFGPLGGPLLGALEAASLGAQAIRSAALAPIHTVEVEVVTEAVIRAMSQRWAMPVVARLVRDRAERTLSLLPPSYLEAVVRTCTTLAAEGRPSLG